MPYQSGNRVIFPEVKSDVTDPIQLSINALNDEIAKLVKRRDELIGQLKEAVSVNKREADIARRVREQPDQEA